MITASPLAICDPVVAKSPGLATLPTECLLCNPEERPADRRTVGREITAVNILGCYNRPGNQGVKAISLRDPVGASPFGLDPSHPRLGGKDPGVAGVK